MVAGTIIRSALSRLGYVLWKREFLRFGVDPFLDIRRLATMWRLPIGTVFDVGANDGGFLGQAHAAFPEARFYSFEPHPATFRRLTERMRLPRTELFELGLGDRRGPVVFHEYGREGDGALINSMVPDAPYAVRGGFPSQPITVPCDTLDLFCRDKGVGHVDVLKIDVEGFEAAVLRGAEGMLRANAIRFVYLEYNDLCPVPKANGGALIPIAEYLSGWGYRCVATYTDFVLADLMSVANALFAVAPEGAVLSEKDQIGEAQGA